MKFLEYRFALDVRQEASRVSLNARRGDTARRLRILLANGTTPYEIEPDCYAVFSALKPDGNRLFNRCTIEDNRIVYEFTPQTVAAEGLMECEIRLYGADDLLITSPGFDMIIDGTVYDEDAPIQSETEVDSLTGLISDATEVITKGRELIGDYEEALDRIDLVLVEAQSYAERAEAAAERAEGVVVEVSMATATASMTRGEIDSVRSADRALFAVCDLFPGVPFQYADHLNIDGIWYARFTHNQIREDQSTSLELLIDDNGKVVYRSVSMTGGSGGGFVAQPEPPEDKSLLWIDTDDETEDEGSDDSSDSSQNVDCVKTVNGVKPDENGNVEITVSGGNADVTIDGETLVIAEHSTATIENETLIL